MTETRKTHLYLLLVALFWGVSFPFMNESLKVTGPFTFVFIRYMGSAVIMSIFFFSHMRKINRDYIRRTLLIGIPFAAAVSLQMVGLQYTSVMNTAFLTSLAVAFVPFIAFIFEGTKPNRIIIVGIVMSLFGTGLMTLDSFIRFNYGDLIVLVGTIAFSFQIYHVEKYGKKVDSITLTSLILFVVALISFPFAILFEKFTIVYSDWLLGSFIYIIFFCTIWGIYIQNRMQPKIPATNAVVIFLFEPVVATTASAVTGDSITTNQWIGAITIVAGILVIVLKYSPQKQIKRGKNHAV